MKLDDYNRWLTLLANVAVFASIMFLAIEIRQNQTAIEESNRLNILEARSLEIEHFNDWRSLLIEDPELARIWDDAMKGQTLDGIDQARFFHLCNNLVWISAGSYERSKALDRLDAANATTSIRAAMIDSSPVFHDCWFSLRDMLKDYGVGDYVNEVESRLTHKP
jgi:hypothetical protein